MLLNLNQMRHSALALLAVVLAGATIGDRPAFAQQDAVKASTQKWRPKNGFYASPGKDFDSRCGEGGWLLIGLDEKTISGDEWSCDVTKLTDAGSSAIKLNMTCNDYNLAGTLKLPEDTRFKETMLLRKIDERTVFVRQTTNGKFGGPGGSVAYCSEDAQRLHVEARERDRAEAEGKPIPEWARPKLWVPRDGVYASPGPDFDDRCMKSDDTIIDFAKKRISGADRCEVYSYNEAELRDPIITVVCNETSAKMGLVSKNIDGGSMFGPPGFEVLRLKRIDEKTIFLEKTHNGVSAPGRQVSYCSDEAQRRSRDDQKTVN
jgi:hypothetical protein